jgi:hypothetical protein
MLCAWLQPSPARGDVARARRLFEQGSQLYAQGRYEEAMKAFLEAHSAKAIPSLLINAALAARKGRNPKKAHELVRRFLADPPRGAQAESEIARATELLRELERELPGTLLVVTTPPGAKVFLGALGLGALGTTPFRRDVPPGNHFLFVELEGFAPQRRAVTLRPGRQTRVEVNLVRTRARVKADRQDTVTVRRQVIAPEAQRSLRPYAWASAAVGTALLGAGAGLAVAAQRKANELGAFEDGTEFSGAPRDVQRQGKAFRASGLAMLVAGGALAVTSVVLFAVEPRGGGSREGRSRRPAQARRRPGRLSLSPMVDGRTTWGAAARVEF